MIKYIYKIIEIATTKNTMKKILIGLVIVVCLITGVDRVYASIYPVQAQGFTLAGSGSSIGDTTLTLSSFKQIDGTNLTMTQFGTIGFGTVEPGNGSQEESITWTGITQNTNGSAVLTGINHVDFVYPFSLTGSLTKSHPGASTLVVSNTSYFYYRMLAFLDNTLNITGYWTAPDPISPQGIATKNYVDGAAFGGIGGATETATGTVQIATGLQIASSTTNGSAGRLVIPASLATSTYNAATAPLKVVVTGNNGKIDPNFVDTSTLLNNATLTGTTTFSTPRAVVDNNGLGLFNSQLLASSTLSAPATSLNISGLPPRTFLKLYIMIPYVTSLGQMSIRFNNDSGSDYSSQAVGSNSLSQCDTFGGGVAMNQMQLGNSSTTMQFSSLEIISLSSTTRQVFGSSISGTLPTKVPAYCTIGGTWTATSSASAAISQITLFSISGGSYPASTTMYVFGSSF